MQGHCAQVLCGGLYGCFYQVGVLVVGILALLCGVCIWAPDFLKLPHSSSFGPAHHSVDGDSAFNLRVPPLLG